MNPAIAARLEELEIHQLAASAGFALFSRGEALALVEMRGAAFGSIGSTGVMTDKGIAYLVWRNGQPLLTAKGGETPASQEQVEAIQRFSEDLKSALAAL